MLVDLFNCINLTNFILINLQLNIVFVRVKHVIAKLTSIVKDRIALKTWVVLTASWLYVLSCWDNVVEIDFDHCTSKYWFINLFFLIEWLNVVNFIILLLTELSMKDVRLLISKRLNK